MTSISHPFLSVITPVDPSRIEYVRETLNSVRVECERFPGSVEWIVIEDGLGDTRSLLEADVRLLGGTWDCQGVHGGVSAARTLGLAHSRGSVVLTLDADDILAPGVTGLLMQAFSEHSRVAAVAGVQDGIIGEVEANDVRISMAPVTRIWAPGELADNWTSPFPFHPGQVAYRREALLATGGWPSLTGGEDRALVLAVNVTGSILATDIPITRYRVWDGQVTSGGAYNASKTNYENITWLLTDARLRAARGFGLDPTLPHRPGR